MVGKLFENHRVVLCRRGYPLAGATTLNELVDAKWVATSVRVNSAAEINPLFERHGLPLPVIAVHTQSALSMITVTASTELLTMLPRQWLGIEQITALLTHSRLDETLVAPATFAVSRARLPLTPMAQHIQDLFRRAGLNQ